MESSSTEVGQEFDSRSLGLEATNDNDISVLHSLPYENIADTSILSEREGSVSGGSNIGLKAADHACDHQRATPISVQKGGHLADSTFLSFLGFNIPSQSASSSDDLTQNSSTPQLLFDSTNTSCLTSLISSRRHTPIQTSAPATELQVAYIATPPTNATLSSSVSCLLPIKPSSQFKCSHCGTSYSSQRQLE